MGRVFKFFDVLETDLGNRRYSFEFDPLSSNTLLSSRATLLCFTKTLFSLERNKTSSVEKFALNSSWINKTDIETELQIEKKLLMMFLHQILALLCFHFVQRKTLLSCSFIRCDRQNWVQQWRHSGYEALETDKRYENALFELYFFPLCDALHIFIFNSFFFRCRFNSAKQRILQKF